MYCYLVRQNGTNYFKIGYSKAPKRRLKDFKTACPGGATLIGTIPGTRADEKRLHELVRAAHVSGEWFQLGRAEQLEVCRMFTPEPDSADSSTTLAQWQKLRVLAKLEGRRGPRGRGGPHPYVVILRPRVDKRQNWAVKVRDPWVRKTTTHTIPFPHCETAEGRTQYAVGISKLILGPQSEPPSAPKA